MAPLSGILSAAPDKSVHGSEQYAEKHEQNAGYAQITGADLHKAAPKTGAEISQESYESQNVHPLKHNTSLALKNADKKVYDAAKNKNSHYAALNICEHTDGGRYILGKAKREQNRHKIRAENKVI